MGRTTSAVNVFRASVLIWLVVFWIPGCATSPGVEVDQPVTEDESEAVVAALSAAVPGNRISLHLVSGETIKGGFVEWIDGVVTLSHAGKYVPERKSYDLKYVRKVDVIVMRPDVLENQ